VLGPGRPRVLGLRHHHQATVAQQSCANNETMFY
jgi:hypothetical protein